MNEQLTWQRMMLYLTAIVNIILACIKIYLSCIFYSFGFAFDGFMHILTGLVCIACSVSAERQSCNVKAEILRILSGFPQVSEVHNINWRKFAGVMRIDVFLSYNTYIVHGSGAGTSKSIEYALKKHFGSDSYINIKVKKISLNADQTSKKRLK